jgi:hypothetical protein
MLVFHSVFQSFHFAQEVLVTFCTDEKCGEEGFGQISGERATEHARAEADAVHVVIFHSLVRGKDVLNLRRSYSFDLIGGDATLPLHFRRSLPRDRPHH